MKQTTDTDMPKIKEQQNSIFRKSDFRPLLLSHSEKRELKEKIQSAINMVKREKG